MIDLGKSKEVTAVLKLLTKFSPKKEFIRMFNIAFWFVVIKIYQMTYVRPHVLLVASKYIWDAMWILLICMQLKFQLNWKCQVGIS